MSERQHSPRGMQHTDAMRRHRTETQMTGWEKEGQERQPRASRTAVTEKAMLTTEALRQEESTDLPLCLRRMSLEPSDLLLPQGKVSSASMEGKLRQAGAGQQKGPQEIPL